MNRHLLRILLTHCEKQNCCIPQLEKSRLIAMCVLQILAAM
jgi:hypothetical protein